MAEAEPMGPDEIRVRLGVSRQRAYIIMNRRDFPAPWRELAMGKVWRSRYSLAARAGKRLGSDEPQVRPRPWV